MGTESTGDSVFKESLKQNGLTERIPGPPGV